MKIKTNLKAGANFSLTMNHNKSVASGMKIKSNIKAGEIPPAPPALEALTVNHNQTVASGVKVKARVRVAINL